MTQFVVKPFLDEISKMKFREKVMGELVGIVPRKLDVSTLLNVVRKYVDIKDEEALKREFAAALNPETEEEKSDRGNGTGIRSCTSLGRCDPNGGQAVVGSRGYHREVC